jgi:hypothetical protein
MLEVEWGVDWIRLAHDWGQWRALVNTIMNLRIQVGDFFINWTTISFSRRIQRHGVSLILFYT